MSVASHLEGPRERNTQRRRGREPEASAKEGDSRRSTRDNIPRPARGRSTKRRSGFEPEAPAKGGGIRAAKPRHLMWYCYRAGFNELSRPAGSGPAPLRRRFKLTAATAVRILLEEPRTWGSVSGFQGIRAAESHPRSLTVAAPTPSIRTDGTLMGLTPHARRGGRDRGGRRGRSVRGGNLCSDISRRRNDLRDPEGAPRERVGGTRSRGPVSVLSEPRW